MSAAAVTIEECARAMKVQPATVRGWIRDHGAPVESEGSCGRGNGARVVISKIQAWRNRRLGLTRDGDAAAALAHFAAALLEVFQRDGGDGAPLHRSIGIPDAKAAALLIAAYQRAHRRLTGADPDRLPPETVTLMTVCVSSSRSTTGERS